MTGSKASEILFSHYGVIKYGHEERFSDPDLLVALFMGAEALTALEGFEIKQKMSGVCLDKEEYEELLEYKYMYEGLQ